MTEEMALMILVTSLTTALVIMVGILLARNPQTSVGDLSELLNQAGIRLDRTLREELDRSRQATASDARDLRGEVGSSMKQLADSIINAVGVIGASQKEGLDEFSGRLGPLTQALQQDSARFREDVRTSVKEAHESMGAQLTSMSAAQSSGLESFGNRIGAMTESNERKLDGLRGTVDERLSTMQTASTSRLDQMREDAAKNASDLRTQLTSSLQVFGQSVAGQITTLVESIEKKMEGLRGTVETKLTHLQADNSSKLEAMRATVEEKLQSTLEKRLGASFDLVSKQLETVHKGLGEMRALASNVGDLKKVLSNVSSRGAVGEIQLERLLQEILCPDQYGENVQTKKDSTCRVEFAVKLPGRSGGMEDVVWLPIDAKFPLEDYHRLIDAQESADQAAIEVASKQLERQIKGCAKLISEKYIAPPETTDFAIMFLATEGLFAEAVRRPGLVETIQRDFHVVIAGPTTLMALLNSLQMGFRTLAIERRSTDVWNILGAV